MVVAISTGGADVALPGGLQGVRLADGALGLLPVPTGLPACLELQRRCRALAACSIGADPRLPATTQSTWLRQPNAEVLPIPRLVLPGGQPLATWLGSGEATAAGLLQALAETAALVDALAGEGWEPETLGLDGVWVDAGHLTWLPVAAIWPRPRRLPTGRSLAASGRALGLFLRALLTASRDLRGMVLVWEELWAICHQWLEHGYGLSAAGLTATLAPLLRRCGAKVEAEEEALRPALHVLVDAGGLQRSLGRRTLDLSGLLRHLLGAEQPVTGTVFSTGALSHTWRQQAAGLGFWAVSPVSGVRQVAETDQSEGRELLLLCGCLSDLAEEMAWLRPRRGRLAVVIAEQAQRLPARWEPILLPALSPWYRIGHRGLA